MKRLPFLLSLRSAVVGTLDFSLPGTFSTPPWRRTDNRQRQVLACLLEGDGEKRVAAGLGIGIGTVHTYVKALYRSFRVAGRAELLAWLVRRAYPRSVLSPADLPR